MSQVENNVGWVSDSVTQQIQDQSAEYRVVGEMSGYAPLTRPTELADDKAVLVPKEWCRAKLGDIANQITKGTTPTTAGFQYLNSGIPFIKIENINQHGIDLSTLSQFISEEAHQALFRSQFQEGDILFSIAGTIGKTALVAQEHIPANTNQAVAIIRSTKQFFDAKFLRQHLKESAKTIAKNSARGGAMNNISLSDLKEVELSIPPFAEQQQIAAKLDELLAQVDTLKTRLDTIPKILKRFRQSVLAAATSGKLTEDWRAIRANSMQTHGESGKVVGNSAPIGCVVDSALLTGWRDVRLADISDVQGGVTKDAKKQLPEDEELPYLRVANVQRGYLDLSEIKTIRVPAGRLAALLLEPGDVLFNEGGDIDKLGRGWVWEGQIERCTFQNHVFRARLYDKTNQSKYISWWGNFRGLSYFLRSGKQTTNLASINKSMLSNLPISLPPPEEQTEIVNRVEQLFAYADQIEQRVKDAQSRVNHLAQTILAKAFRGELTADWREQNPDLISGENSAAALLARIKAERQNQETNKVTNRHTQKRIR